MARIIKFRTVFFYHLYHLTSVTDPANGHKRILEYHAWPTRERQMEDKRVW